MSKREHESEDEKNREDEREEERERSYPAGLPCSPSVGYREYIREDSDRLSALSYITCTNCKTIYLKGDEHECS